MRQKFVFSIKVKNRLLCVGEKLFHALGKKAVELCG